MHNHLNTIKVASVAMKSVAGTEESVDLEKTSSSLEDNAGEFSCCINSSTKLSVYNEISQVLERAVRKAGNLGKHAGMIVASNFLEGFYNEKVFDGKMYHATNEIVEKLYDNMGIDGPLLINSTACSSGGNALVTGCQMLKDGMADSVIVIGYEVKNIMSQNGMKKIGALTKSRICPFSLEREGTALAEGIGVVILKSAQSTEKQEKEISIAGYGIYEDGYNITSPKTDGESLYLAMEHAIKMAGINREEIDYINTHGSGTKINDKMETNIISQLFGKHARKLYINSTKSLIGHTLGASEVIEFIFTVLQMERACIHPTVNYQTYDAECYLNCCANKSVSKRIRYGLTNSIGFGGINVSILLKNSVVKEENSEQ